MGGTYRIGVIGHTGRGNYGHGLDRVWLDIPGCEVVAVADPDPSGRAQAAKRLQARYAFADYREMLEKVKPDIVSVAPRWIDQHCDMVLAAAAHGAHVYLEKPMCRTPEEADRMVAACEKHGIKLAIAFQTRYSPKLPAIRDVIADGVLGEILEWRARGKEDHRGGGEDLWVLGSHLMNLIHHLAGEPRWCFARLWQNGELVGPQHVVQGNEGIGPLAGDTVHALYGLPESQVATFDSCRGAAGGRFGLTIYGSRGVMEILTGYLPAVHVLEDPTWSPGRSGKKWVPVSSAGLGKPEPLQDGGLHAGNVLACRDLIAAIQDDRLPEANVYEGRMTVEMISAVFESHRAEGPVTFPLKQRDNPLKLLKEQR